MEFRIADTFTASLARLSGDEQKAVKTTAFDLQLDPASPGMSFHKLEKARDKKFWSVRVSGDLRLIVHRGEGSLLLCYVDHHDKAYAWAERRKLETHPRTGAAQLVELRERVQEVPVKKPAKVRPARIDRLLFANMSREQLLAYGVPPEWLDAVLQSTEDDILEVADHLPAEAAEALLEWATGGPPRPPAPTPPKTPDPFEHPDARRRFRLISTATELEQALDAPWEAWTIFLHPEQRESVERSYNGPARVSGSAGTGKTIVALHRAVYLTRNHPDARVLLTTFSEPLANALRAKLRRLIGSEPRLAERLEVHALEAVARRLYEPRLGRVKLASPELIGELLEKALVRRPELKLTLRFLASEWEDVVDAWQLDTWDAYRSAARLGRKTRLPEKQREAAWAVFDEVRKALGSRALLTRSALYHRLADHLATLEQPPYDFAVVDEAQDFGVAQLRFLAALAAGRPNGLFFAGDLGQRIFQRPFSWKALGIDIRGRSRTLRVNYRTSHQIRASADRLLGPSVSDVDGNTDTRRGTVSVFNGPEPELATFQTQQAEIDAVGAWLRQRAAEGMAPQELGVFVRSAAELPRARAAVEAAGLAWKLLDEHVETASGHVSVGTMHLAKGLEFRAVAVIACDDAVIPLQERIETAGDDTELEEVYDTERHLLYVACTRARESLLASSVEPASEFLDDLQM
jgi:mRNA-degrading endonuclease RelE of RelBE toxin-antitoxin system